MPHRDIASRMTSVGIEVPAGLLMHVEIGQALAKLTPTQKHAIDERWHLRHWTEDLSVRIDNARRRIDPLELVCAKAPHDCEAEKAEVASLKEAIGLLRDAAKDARSKRERVEKRVAYSEALDRLEGMLIVKQAA